MGLGGGQNEGSAERYCEDCGKYEPARPRSSCMTGDRQNLHKKKKKKKGEEEEERRRRRRGKKKKETKKERGGGEEEKEEEEKRKKEEEEENVHKQFPSSRQQVANVNGEPQFTCSSLGLPAGWSGSLYTLLPHCGVASTSSVKQYFAQGYNRADPWFFWYVVRTDL